MVEPHHYMQRSHAQAAVDPAQTGAGIGLADVGGGPSLKESCSAETPAAASPQTPPSFVRSPLTELAWAAGFWDGEGSAWFDPTRTGGRLGIGQNDRETPDRFAAAVDGGSISGPYERHQNEHRDGYKRKPRYKWQSSRKADTRRIMELLYPFVSGQERAQFDRIFGAPGDQSALFESPFPERAT